MKKTTILLDAGHGGMLNGQYQTVGKKQYHFTNDKFTVYEGEVNRAMVLYLEKALQEMGFPTIRVMDWNKDTPLKKRVAICDAVNAVTDCLLLSIHNNAASKGIRGTGSKATGTEAFTSRGETESDKWAEYGLKSFMKRLPNRKMRLDKTDGDLDKEADFYVLRESDCPAVLWELGFYDNREDAEFITFWKNQEMMMDAIARGVLDAYNALRT